MAGVGGPSAPPRELKCRRLTCSHTLTFMPPQVAKGWSEV